MCSNEKMEWLLAYLGTVTVSCTVATSMAKKLRRALVLCA